MTSGPVRIDPMLRVLVWTVVTISLWRVGTDPDLWGHLRFGTDLLQGRKLSALDPYSFTSDVPWVNHEWMSEGLMALAFQLWGGIGLLVLKLAVAAVAAVALSRQLRGLPVLTQAGLILLTAWASIPVVTTMRPQLFSYSLAAVLAGLLANGTYHPRYWLIPPIFALWVNLHGGWLVGLWLIGVWCLTGLSIPTTRATAVAVGAATLAATLLNPYGIGMWTFLEATVGLSRDIRDWRPLTAAPFLDWWPWLLTLAMVVVVEALQERRSMSRTLTLSVLAYASFRVVRLIPFFTLISVIYLSPAIKRLTARSRLNWSLFAPSRVAALGALIPSAALVMVSAPSIVARVGCIPIEGDWVPERWTAKALHDAKPRGRIVTPFAWGQYTIWHFGPALRVSLDGRRETVYSAAWMEELWGMEVGFESSLPLYEKFRPEYVWLPSEGTGRIRSWLVQNGYRIDIESERAWVAVRADQPHIRPAEQPAPACFPG